MVRASVALTFVLAAHATTAAGQAARCDPETLRDAADTARSNIIAGIDGAAAIAAWKHVLDAGGSVGWTVTEYNVDPRSTFVFAFDREALRVYRAGAFGADVEAATGGCIDGSASPEAVIPSTASHAKGGSRSGTSRSTGSKTCAASPSAPLIFSVDCSSSSRRRSIQTSASS